MAMIWTANKKMILASSWDNVNSVDFLKLQYFPWKLQYLRGLLQHLDVGHHDGHRGQGDHAGGRRRRLQVWFQILTIWKFSCKSFKPGFLVSNFHNLEISGTSPNSCLSCKYAIIGEGWSNYLEL